MDSDNSSSQASYSDVESNYASTDEPDCSTELQILRHIRLVLTKYLLLLREIKKDVSTSAENYEYLLDHLKSERKRTDNGETN